MPRQDRVHDRGPPGEHATLEPVAFGRELHDQRFHGGVQPVRDVRPESQQHRRVDGRIVNLFSSVSVMNRHSARCPIRYTDNSRQLEPAGQGSRQVVDLRRGCTSMVSLLTTARNPFQCDRVLACSSALRGGRGIR